MIYGFLKRLFRLSLFFFFKKIAVRGKEHIPDEGPLIIVSNHPNTMIDPILIASIFKRRIGFIAKSVIFINKLVSSILSFFNIIPIIRKSDLKKGENLNNEAAFEKCHAYLAKRRTFLIFPEGISIHELKLREIKTGTARIALSFEELNDFKGDLKILPIALDYSDAVDFRSSISVIINEPIEVGIYKEQYASDSIKAVSHLTEEIRENIAKHIPNAYSKEEEDFLIKLHKFYMEYINTTVDSARDKTLWLRNKISKVMHDVYDENKNKYDEIHDDVLHYFQLIKEEQLTFGFFKDSFFQKSKFLVIFWYFIKLIILFPVYIFGLAVNYIPYIVPYKIFKLSKLEIEYKSSVQMASGLILFPLFYWLEIVLVRRLLSDEVWLTILFPFIFLICGYISLFYWSQLKRFYNTLHFYFNVSDGKKKEILNLRDQLSKEVKRVEQWYLTNNH